MSGSLNSSAMGDRLRATCRCFVGWWCWRSGACVRSGRGDQSYLTTYSMRVQHALAVGLVDVLERVGERRVEARDARDRARASESIAFSATVAAISDAKPSVRGASWTIDEAAGLAHRREHGVGVPRQERAQVDQLDRDALLRRRLHGVVAGVDHRAPRDERHRVARVDHACLREVGLEVPRGDLLLQRGGRAPSARGTSPGRSGRSTRAACPSRRCGVRRHHHAQARRVDEVRLGRLRVVVAALDAAARGRADDDRAGVLAARSGSGTWRSRTRSGRSRDR